MNEKAKSLDMNNTWFSNPHGLQNALNTSSPKDIIKLSRYCIKNKLFQNIVNTKEYHYNVYEDKGFLLSHSKKWVNTNKLLLKGWEGIKTGHTVSAGYCLASLKEGIFIVVLNS